MEVNRNGTTRTKMDFSKLEDCIDALHGYAGGDRDEVSLSPALAEQAALYLEWLAEKKESSKMYHRLANEKKKEFTKIALTMLSKDEKEEIERRLQARMEGRNEE